MAPLNGLDIFIDLVLFVTKQHHKIDKNGNENDLHIMVEN